VFRDRGPIHNIGYGVSSRELPSEEGETEQPSPGSGRIAKALDGHPVMKFFGAAATAIAVTTVASRVTKSGGLRLGKFLQDSSDKAIQSGKYDRPSTRLVKGILDLRQGLDELESVTRQVGGLDDYSRLVEKVDGKFTTGYDGRRSARSFIRPISKEGQKTTGTGLSSESAEVWTYRDEIQKRLVRAGRRLPYELPALYVTQKAITEPLFGYNQDKKKVNWYNPVDVLTDFVKTSTINIATMTLPFEGLGAAGAAGKSSLTTLANSMNDLNALSPIKQKASSFAFDLKSLLAEVGHDAADVLNKGIKLSSKTSGAFAAGVQEADKAQPEFLAALRAARHGAQDASRRASDKNAGKLKTLTAGAKAFFVAESDDGYGALDSFPGVRGMSSGFKAAKNQFYSLGVAHDVISGKLTREQALGNITKKFSLDRPDILDEALKQNHTRLKLRGLAGTDAKSILEDSINKIQSQHSSSLSRLAHDFDALGRGGPSSSRFTSSNFYQGRLRDEYKDQLENKLVSGYSVDRKAAKSFVDNLKINELPKRNTSVSLDKRIALGRKAINVEGDEFFDEIIKRFQGIKGGKDFASAIPGGSALRQSLEEVDSLFISQDFRKNLDLTIRSQWNQVSKNQIGEQASSILKPTKQSYTDFVGDLTDEKKSFLLRKTAKTLGVPLTQSNGKLFSESVLSKSIAQQGIDPTDFQYMRDYLLENKGLTTGFFSGSGGIFGLKPVLVDEAVERGMFSHLSDEQQSAISQIASLQASRDPLTRGLGSATETLGQTRVGGVYQTRDGEILDFTKVKSVLSNAKNFMASEFKIPILNFNPADMLGYQSLRAAREAPLLQYVSSRSVQPFLGSEAARPEFYLFAKNKGSKGSLTGFTQDQRGMLDAQTIAGSYRPISSSSTELISREARNAAGLTGQSADQIAGRTEMAGKTGRMARFRRAFDIDEEQPNSLYRLGQRFKRRSSDIENPATMARLIKDGSITYREKGATKRLTLQGLDDTDAGLSVVDDLGNVRFNQRQILSAVDSFRTRIFGSGIHSRVRSSLEDSRPDLFTSNGVRSSQVTSHQSFKDVHSRLMADLANTVSKLRNAGKDPREIIAAHSKINKYLDQSFFNSSSQLSARSGVINTRIDEASNEVFRLISLKNQMLNETEDIFTQTTKAIRDLQKQGKIGLNDAIEARIGALGNLFNFSAHATFKGELSGAVNARNALREVSRRTQSSEDIASLFTPFTTGADSMIGSSIRRPFSRALPLARRAFGSAPYQISEDAVNTLGTGQAFTFVPTFGTAIQRNPAAAIRSAMGLGTYKNQDAFSTGSVASAHLVSRVNRYFGTFGLQLDQSKYGGPVDLYMRGMVGKRVLPIVAGGTTLLAADRTIGGYTNEKDKYGERVYSPYFTTKMARGIVEVHALGAGLIPGGMSAEEKRKQLLEGEVPIKQGRFWALGTTPFMGGNTMYYRPSYYRKLKEAGTYTSDSFESPLEKLAYGYDFSPLRPFDPYRFERQHYEDRPYPVSGEYFTGPFGPATAFANMTIGKILKPQIKMHEDELREGLAGYQRAGEAGAYDTTGYMAASQGGFGGGMGYGGTGSSGGGSYGASTMAIGGYNSRLSQVSAPMGTAGRQVKSTIGGYNSSLRDAVGYGPPKLTGVMTPSLIPAGEPIESNKIGIQAGELGYRVQEMAGIYGFTFGQVRESFGFGQSDYEPQRAVLQSAAKGYGSTRSFWDLNLGGLGDAPLGGEGALGNLEISEVVRRFIPKERSNVNYINPIRNTMGEKYPFLPGAEYFTDFQRGDPFTKVPDGEIRLPGRGYERFNTVSADETGKYGKLNQLDILADIAPYSKQFRSLNNQIQTGSLSPDEKIRVQTIRDQAEDVTTKYDFTPYKYKDTTAEEMGMNPRIHAISRVGEYLAHRDTFFNTKFMNKRTATEDWERRNVYGSTFPEWQRPYESFIEPMLNKASQRDPIVATAGLAVAGSMFGKGVRGKTLGSLIGAAAGFTSSVKGNLQEAITGDRFIPETRKKELALEEYSDILSYVKNTSLANQAQASGDAAAAASFQVAARRTMYGADLETPSLETLSLSVPKRKREHFKAMINAPENEREQILSTAGRLERRIYQSAWGMAVEEKPDLADYFSRHELPSQNWEGWHPNTNLEHVKIKTGQSMGLEMSQMGYYPQQIREANLANPSYPSFFGGNKNEDTAAQLRAMMSRMGVSGSVSPVRNPYGSNSININAGVR
jgi:hypothetical protein